MTDIETVMAQVLDSHERQEPGCVCGWAYDDASRTYDEHLGAALLAALDAGANEGDK